MILCFYDFIFWKAVIILSLNKKGSMELKVMRPPWGYLWIHGSNPDHVALYDWSPSILATLPEAQDVLEETWCLKWEKSVVQQP